MIGQNEEPAKDDVIDVLSRPLAGAGPEWRPLLAVVLARAAAERYRKWAAMQVGDRHRSRLLECAERADQIARAVAAVYPRAAAVEFDVAFQQAELEEIDGKAFGARSLAEQFLIQAHGAELAAATWRGFAERERDAARRRAFVACADLEEINALVLGVILRPRR